ncbi:unnamed protein product [Rotaria sp. Silwood2]|nr:unnamed protein product [Rotaria sp. Silwood2]
MSTNTLEEIEFLLALQKFTVHCVSNQCSSKIKSYCIDLLIAVTHLPKVYIGHKIQLALALETASLRNETRLILNDYMNIISHLIYLVRSNLNSEEEKKCAKWTGIDLVSLLNQCENRFKKQSYSSTVWIEILNETSMVSYNMNNFENISFDFVQHDTDIEQLFQWIDENKIKIPGRFNRTYGGIPLFWCTSSSSQLHSKYGSIRLIFQFSIVYSSTQRHLFDLRKRKHGSDRWHNILITTREQIAGYGTDFIKLSSIPSMPLDIAIDLTDGPLILSDVRITFFNHTDRCIPILPEKLTPQHSCYNTS